jgi:tetratricopeptide (TPR) repeat protein
MSTVQAEESRGPQGQVGRAGRSSSQLWQVPTFFLGLLAFIAAFVTAPSRQNNAVPLLQQELVRLRQGLEPDQEKPANLVAHAENLLAHLSEFPARQAGEVHFLAGSAYFRQAQQCSIDNLETNQKKAIDHLEEALALGVAAGDLMPLQYRLGYALYQQGKDMSRAIDLMALSVDKGADRAAHGYGLLVQAYLALAKPNIDAALLANQKQLELTDDRNVEDMALARLARGDLLLRKEQRQESLKELERVGPTAPRPLRLKARLLQARVCEEEGLWNRAIPVWKELLKDADGVPGGKARILYSLGLAFVNADPARPEQALASWQEAFGLGGDEGEAAGIRLGEMRLYGPKGDVKSALEVWSKVLEKVNVANEYKIQTLELSRAREILDNACRYTLENQEFDHTRQIAELYKKIAPAGLADERLAQAAEGLARAWREEAKQLAPQEAAAKMEEVRSRFHQAAVAYAEAAAARAGDGQADLYWRSAECYLASKDHGNAAAVLNKFVQVEKNEGRQAEGWFTLAEAYVSLGNKDLAQKAYYKCIEFPLTTFAARSRYQLALEEMDKKNYDQALEILQQNLQAQGPMHDRESHENSIFKIAELVYRMKDYDKAALYFKEATRQYPNNRDIMSARDQLAECYKKLAEIAQARMLSAKDATTKAIHQKTRQQWLKEGVDVYQTQSDQLEPKVSQNTYTALELGYFRKALLGAADLCFDMNDYDAALRRYQVMQKKYRKRVEGLVACQRIYHCTRYMVETPEHQQKGRMALDAAHKMAQADLEAMPADDKAFSAGQGVWSKADWQEWLRRVGEQLHPPANAPARPKSVI